MASRPSTYHSANTIIHEKGRALSLEPEKKRQRDEIAPNEEEAAGPGTNNDSSAVCHFPCTAMIDR